MPFIQYLFILINKLTFNFLFPLLEALFSVYLPRQGNTQIFSCEAAAPTRQDDNEVSAGGMLFFNRKWMCAAVKMSREPEEQMETLTIQTAVGVIRSSPGYICCSTFSRLIWCNNMFLILQSPLVHDRLFTSSSFLIFFCKRDVSQGSWKGNFI